MLEIRAGFSLAMVIAFVSSMSKQTMEGNIAGILFVGLAILPFIGNIIRKLKRW